MDLVISDAIRNLKGIVPPMLLPLTDNQEIDFESIDRFVEFLIAGGVDGLWVNGTSGEFFALNDDQRQAVIERVVRQVNGRVPVIGQVGDTAVKLVVEHARRALDAGVDGLSVVGPYYLPFSAAELREHYRAVAHATGRSLFMYHVPQMSHVQVSSAWVLQLAQEGILMGIKDSSADLDFFQRLLAASREDKFVLRCFHGASSLIGIGAFIGAHGSMAAITNLLPQHCKRCYQESLGGQAAVARQAHLQVIDLFQAEAIPARGIWAPTLPMYKWFLKELGIFSSAATFDAMQGLSPTEQDQLRVKALPLVRELVAEALSAL